jgi:hypothetical protein
MTEPSVAPMPTPMKIRELCQIVNCRVWIQIIGKAEKTREQVSRRKNSYSRYTYEHKELHKLEKGKL